ncbi:MAG: hypothetical protein ACOYIA_02075 [Eubacteriales bacterium]|jgi:hypothetical protein
MKKDILIRLLCFFTAALMVLCMLAACTENKEIDEKEDTSALGDDTGDEDSPQTVDENGYILDTVPTDTLDYNRKVTLLYWSDVEHEEFVSDGQDGEPVNDSIFLRNLAVEDRLGIDLDFTSTPANSSNVANWVAHVRNDISSGAKSFDLMAAYSLSMASTASNGLCYNLLDPDCVYLNFDMPWWPDRLITEATINDKLYFCSGDISANALYMMYVCYVNNKIVEERGLPNVFELVENNQWTYTKFIEMCAGIYNDNNGNGIKDVGDQFGYMTGTIHMDPWFYGSGALIVDKDENGNLRMSPSFGGEKVIKTLEMLNRLLHDTNDGIATGSTVYHQKEFNNGNLLFTTDRARIAITQLTSEDLDFSIVPFCKYDEAQESYVTVMGNPFTLYGIPINAIEEDLPMLSAILEVYASESYRKVTPALYEITLKTKYVHNEDSARMYDIIRENLTFDLGRIFSSELMGQSSFRNAVLNNSAGSWASLTKSYQRTIPAKLEKLITAYED